MISVYLMPNDGAITSAVVNQILAANGVAGQYQKDKDGKPLPVAGYYLSVSHTKGLIAVALSDAPIGVDVEQIRDVNYAPVLKRWGMDDCGKSAFFELWTRAESAFKLAGGQITPCERTGLKTRTYTALDYVLSISSTDFNHCVDFRVENGCKLNFEFLR
jgi:phosphopantetheinyl transferase